MTEQQIIAACCKLEGRKYRKRYTLNDCAIHHEPSLDYNFIVPIIQKQNGTVLRAIERGLSDSGILYDFQATPAQLAEILLRVTGNRE